MIKYCNETNLKICYDLCHSQLYCNKLGINIIDELTKISSFVDHFHLSDAEGVDGEGLQIGEGNMDFEKIIPILNKFNEKSFAIEVWKGHENGGKGFEEFLDEIIKRGLIVN
jgi:N-acetylneuraminate synthase